MEENNKKKMEKSNKKKVKRYIIIGIIILTTLLLIQTITYGKGYYNKIISIMPDNIYLNDIDLSGKTKEEVKGIVDEIQKDILDIKVNIKCNKDENDYSYDFKLNELGVKTNSDLILNDLYDLIGKGETPIDKIKKYLNSKNESEKYNIEYTFDDSTFLSKMDVLSEIELKEPVNAEYKYSRGKIVITEGKKGIKLDIDSLLDSFKEKVLDNKDLNDINLEVSFFEKDPDITAKDIEDMGMNEVIGKYTTYFSLSNIPRNENIKVAVRTVNGTVLEPGEEFSLSKKLGAITAAKGYKESSVYRNGTVSTGIGGGLCQVSTTLYNSALYANLEVLRRSNHSLTVPYVPLSRDAAVSFPVQDFKFKNDTDKYMYIHCHVYKNTLTFELIGTKKDDVTIKLETVTHETIEPEIEETEDTTLEPGERVVDDKGHTGYKSSLYKHIYKNGKRIKTIRVSTDYYKTTPIIVRVNTSTPEEENEDDNNEQDNNEDQNNDNTDNNGEDNTGNEEDTGNDENNGE